jgi:hypothetical protein
MNRTARTALFATTAILALSTTAAMADSPTKCTITISPKPPGGAVISFGNNISNINLESFNLSTLETANVQLSVDGNCEGVVFQVGGKFASPGNQK